MNYTDLIITQYQKVKLIKILYANYGYALSIFYIINICITSLLIISHYLLVVKIRSLDKGYDHQPIEDGDYRYNGHTRKNAHFFVKSIIRKHN